MVSPSIITGISCDPPILISNFLWCEIRSTFNSIQFYFNVSPCYFGSLLVGRSLLLSRSRSCRAKACPWKPEVPVPRLDEHDTYQVWVWWLTGRFEKGSGRIVIHPSSLRCQKSSFFVVVNTSDTTHARCGWGIPRFCFYPMYGKYVIYNIFSIWGAGVLLSC